MRYVIIPLGIILYILWSVISIKDIKRSWRLGGGVEFHTYMWAIVNLILLIILSVLYW